MKKETKIVIGLLAIIIISISTIFLILQESEKIVESNQSYWKSWMLNPIEIIPGNNTINHIILNLSMEQDKTKGVFYRTFDIFSYDEWCETETNNKPNDDGLYHHWWDENKYQLYIDSDNWNSIPGCHGHNPFPITTNTTLWIDEGLKIHGEHRDDISLSLLVDYYWW